MVRTILSDENNLKTLEAATMGGTAVTIGKFDGIHLGHRLLVDAVTKKASADHLISVLMTFTTSPRAFLSADRRMLFADNDRVSYLNTLGIDLLAEFPFSDDLRTMSPEAFVRDILVGLLHVRYVAVGTDFHFGYERSGDGEALKKLGLKYGFTVDLFEKVQYEGAPVSSTRIRTELQAGRMEQVSAMLGHPYTITNTIVHGKALGRTIGFPTINLIPDAFTLLPPNGVYFSKVRLGDQYLYGVANLGQQPTADVHTYMLEVHLFDFSEDVYGKTATAELYHFERAEQKFDDFAALSAQLASDQRQCLTYFGLL